MASIREGDPLPMGWNLYRRRGLSQKYLSP